MKKQWLWTLALILGIVTSAFSGDLHVVGPVYGKWDAGTRVFVESACWVPEGRELMVEEGVEINFLTKHQFVVNGNLQMIGTFSAPVVLKPCDSWAGMLFNYNGDLQRWHILKHVEIDPSSPLAKRIVETEDVAIFIEDCSFISNHNSIRINGGLIQAHRNSFLTYASASKVVEIHNLVNSPLNYLRTNLIQIEGDSEHSGRPVPVGLACGLLIRGSTSLEILDNKIQLWMTQAPSCGIDFGNTEDFPDGRLVIDSCVVKIQTPNYWACALQSIQDNTAFVDVLKTTIDVIIDGESPDARAFAIRVQNNGSIYMSSSAFELTSAHETNVPYLVYGDSSRIDVRYSVRWHEQQTTSSLSSGAGSHDRKYGDIANNGLFIDGFSTPRDLLGQVNEYEVISDQNPGFIRAGAEGIWQSHADVELYYGLTADSPCRDAGDPELDETNPNIPDAGRYEFIIDAAEPVYEIPSTFAVDRAYPNPFNPTTTIALEMARTGYVQMTLYDILGRVAGNVFAGHLNGGSHSVIVDGSNLASGVYLLNVEFNGQSMNTQRMVLLK